MKFLAKVVAVFGYLALGLRAKGIFDEEAEENWIKFGTGGLRFKFRDADYYRLKEDVERDKLSEIHRANPSTSSDNQDPIWPFPPQVGYIPIYPEDPSLSGNKMFYWLFDSQTNPDTDPLVIWLQGGPGCASTLGLFSENGPFYVEEYYPDPKTKEMKGKKKADIRTIAWNQKANLLFPDQPIGVGFSDVTKGKDARDFNTVMDQFLRFYRGFLKQYPKFKGREVYITGESYGGQWVPYTAYSLFQANDPDINLAGIGIGNGLIYARDMFTTYPDFSIKFANYTKLTQEHYQTAKKVADLCGHIVDNFYNPMIAAYPEDICNTVNDLSLIDADPNFDEYYMPSDVSSNSSFYYFLNDPEVQKTIGVDKLFSGCNGTFGNNYFPSNWWVDSRQFIVPMLLSGVKTLVYDGDLDFICNYLQEEVSVDNMEWFGKSAWSQKDFIQCEQGLCKQYKNLKYIRFSGAGHMVPSFKPQEAMDMINELIAW